jgi:exopolyphosphatase/guanosine-5'-triphosphate,3'-diphosphate pyrophosphatase
MKAAIDCGTNSTRLLIIDDDKQPVVHELRLTRLGQGVDASRMLTAEAIDRTIAVLSEYKALMRQHDVRRFRAVATSAARDASNGGDFLLAARAVLGADLEILSGDEEAAVTYQGAAGAGLVDGPALVVDIGGGSTELAFGRGRKLERSASLDVGCVRLTEQLLSGDPYVPESVTAAATRVDDLISASGLAISTVDATADSTSSTIDCTVVAVAGTATTLAAVHQGETVYYDGMVHGNTLALADIDRLIDRLAVMTNDERLEVPLLVPGRADIIVAGAVILRQVMQWVRAEQCVVSEKDLLFGLVDTI